MSNHKLNAPNELPAASVKENDSDVSRSDHHLAQSPPIAPVKEIQEDRPNAAPVIRSSDDKRIEAGLNFWRTLLWIVGGSIGLLLIFIAAIEVHGSIAVNDLYKDALLKAAADDGVTVNSDKLRALQTIAHDARESLQAFRTAWQQAAQLILINLLLPVVTALLGYIFGVQQGRASESAERRSGER